MARRRADRDQVGRTSQGKLRYVALSNYPAWQVTQALWIADDRRLAAAPTCVQVKYNLIDRAAEHELAETVEEITANATAADVILEPGQLETLTALGTGDDDS